MTSPMAPDSKISVESFARHCNGQMIPINGSLSYFSVIPLEDGDLQRLVYDPAATVPPKAHEIVPKINLVVVGYLEKPSKGEVVAVGNGKLDDHGKRNAPEVKVGETVLFGKYAGTEIKLDGVEHIILREDDILAIVEAGSAH